MKPRILMVSSALFMAALGLATSFVPAEILKMIGAAHDEVLVLVVQVVGALYLGFAFLDWTARGSILGGIYGRRRRRMTIR